MRTASRILTGLGPMLLTAVLCCPQPAVSQDAVAPAAKAQPPAAKKFRGRLPNYYRQVVDEKQRAAIYDIQKGYAPKIEALRAQLEAMQKELDEKVAEVLTPEQRQKVDAARAAAEAKRRKKVEKPAEPAPEK